MNRNQLIKVFFLADYKELDCKKIIDFLMSNGGIATVNDILAIAVQRNYEYTRFNRRTYVW